MGRYEKNWNTESKGKTNKNREDTCAEIEEHEKGGTTKCEKENKNKYKRK